MPSKCPGDRREPGARHRAGREGGSQRRQRRESEAARACGAWVPGRRRLRARPPARGGRGSPHAQRGGRALDARLLGNCVRLSVGFRESPLPSPRNNRFGGFTFWGRRRGETHWGIRGAKAVSELPPQLLCTLKLNWAETNGPGPSKIPRRCWRTCLPGSHLYSSSEKSQIWEEPELERKKICHKGDRVSILVTGW